MRNSLIGKPIFSIVLALVLAFSVTGCHMTWLPETSDKTEVSETESSLEESKETLQMPSTEETKETAREIADKSEGSTEILPVATRETEETEATVEKEKIEIVYELDPEQDFYYIRMPLDGNIQKEDENYVITGEMHYAGRVVITWQQKELLDAGEAVLIIMYQGNEVDRIARDGLGTEPHGPGEEYTYFNSYKGMNSWGRFRVVKSPDSDERMLEQAGVDLSAEPYNGVGYSLHYAESLPKAYYEIVLKKEYRLEIPGDTVIEPYQFLAYTYSYTDWEKYEELVNQTWTVERYYEEAVVPDAPQGSWLHVYEEDGKVVKIVEPFTV